MSLFTSKVGTVLLTWKWAIQVEIKCLKEINFRADFHMRTL